MPQNGNGGGPVFDLEQLKRDDPNNAYIIEAAEKSTKLSLKVDKEKVVPGETFSKEAIQAQSDAVTRFILARIMVDWHRRPKGFSHMTIDVEVTTE